MPDELPLLWGSDEPSSNFFGPDIIETVRTGQHSTEKERRGRENVQKTASSAETAR